MSINRGVLLALAILIAMAICFHFFGKDGRPKIEQAATPNIPATKSIITNAKTNDKTEAGASWDWTNQVPVERRAWTIDRAKKLIAISSGLNVPVEFHGRVVDQFDQPVSGVRVTASYNQWTAPGLVAMSPGRATSEYSSDVQGRFAVNDIKAASMTIELSKAGYELAPHSKLTFMFEPGAQFRFLPNPTNPVVYQMWKRQEAAELKSFYCRSMIPSDGQSIWVGEGHEKFSNVELTNAILKLSVKRERRIETPEDQSPYTWGFEINMLGGGIQLTSDPFLFLAPETSYLPMFSASHKAGDSGWVREQKIIFYFKTSANQYGHGEAFISNWMNQDGIYCEMSLAWNPDGSRNLESKPQ